MNEQLLKEIAKNLEKLVELKALELKYTHAKYEPGIVDGTLEMIDSKYEKAR